MIDLPQSYDSWRLASPPEPKEFCELCEDPLTEDDEQEGLALCKSCREYLAKIIANELKEEEKGEGEGDGEPNDHRLAGVGTPED